MKAANPYDANGYHTEIVSGSFDDLQQPSQVRAEPIRTIAYDQEYQYEDDDTDRKYRTSPPYELNFSLFDNCFFLFLVKTLRRNCSRNLQKISSQDYV